MKIYLLDESRPYAPTSNRYMVFSDEQLMYDPFGYYLPRSVSGDKPDPNFVYLEDFPMDDDRWDLDAEMTNEDE